MTLVGFLMGCLPEAAPFRCDLAGGDRACDGVAGSRCLEGSCAAPVSTSVCASGFAFSASAATPGRCATLTGGDAAIDATTAPDATVDDRLSVDVTVGDRGADDVAKRLDVTVLDRSDVALADDVPAPLDRALPLDAPLLDVSVPDVPVADVSREAGIFLSETPPASVAKVVGGFFHTCARLVDNRVWCWGSNEQGQLGINQTTPYVPNPVRVNLADVVDVAAGAFHTCALTLGGEVHCWGRNSERQLGVAAPAFAFEPVRVATAPAGVSSLALGSSHTCVSTDRAEVFCWGNNALGAAGVSSTANDPVAPTRVPGVTGHFVTAGDAFTCAGSGNRVWCWGRNLYGETGPTPTPPGQTASPTLIAGAVATDDNLIELSAGGFTACARGIRGVRCWGRADLGAIPGSAAATSQITPAEVPYYATTQPVLGYINQCGVGADSALRCWGANDLGASGTGSVTRTTTPPTSSLPLQVQRAGSRPIVGLGPAHTCAVDSTGVLRCWGARYFGQLGDGRLALAPVPVEVIALRDAASLHAGRAFTCARRGNTAGVSCVGVNSLGQLGGSSATSTPLPTTEPAPVTVASERFNGAPLQAVTQLSTGLAHSCAISTTRGLVCWGYNFNGQVNPALGAANVYFGATAPFHDLLARGVACGAAHTCAVDNLGFVRCWGSNERGGAGQASSVERATGALVVGLTGVSSLAAGSAFTCALTSAGRVECFGANDLGQCGTGATLPSSVTLPSERVAVIPSAAAEVTAGAQHACARVGREVRCWGSNQRGQLGAPLTEPRYATRATAVAGLGPADEVHAAGAFTCARVAGRVWCWGANHRGQLGDGTFTDRAAPVEVMLPRDEAFVEVATGEEHACARTAAGRVYCWGSNHLGQLGLSDALWITRAEQGAVRWPR